MRNLVFTLFMTFLSGFVGAQSPFQTIRGKVVDAVSRETLPNASVMLEGTTMGTITGVDGAFVLEEVPVGRYSLRVCFLGYTPAIVPEILVGAGKEIVLEIQMKACFSELDEVIIKPSMWKDRPINSMASVSARTFSVEEARRYAGSLDDPGRMAGNFAGVTTAGLNNNAIVVRGNAPKGLLWRLEGVDIPVPSHFAGSNVAGGGGLTMFSSQMLTNSDFYTGAFPAAYGNATAGVFDMKLRNGNNHHREYAAQIGVQGLELAAEGPFKDGGQGSFLFNYRYSTMALVFRVLPETREETELPVYQDLSFKFNLLTKKAGVFSIWGIGGLSESTSKGYDNVGDWQYPESREYMNFQYNMGVGGLTHRKSLSANTYVKSTIALSAGLHLYDERVRLDHEKPSLLIPRHYVENVSGKVIFSTLLNHKWNARFTMRCGVDLNRLFYRLKGSALNYESGDFNPFLNGKGNTALSQCHVQGKYMLTPKVVFTAGFNASWFRMNRDFLMEPRLSGQWLVNSRHRFSLGYGTHSQTENLFVYFVKTEAGVGGGEEYPNKELKRTRAHHFVLSYDWALTDNLRLKVEPYYQFLFKVPVLEGSSFSMLNFKSDWTFDKSLVNEGTGNNVGIDFTLERFLKDGYYFMGTASFYRSEYKGGDGITRRTRYDGGYVVNSLGGKEWLLNKRNLLGVSFKLSCAGPCWFQPVDEVATDLRKEVVYDDLQPFSERFSSLETISDFTLTYRINKRKISFVWALQVKNVAGRQYQGKRYNLKTKRVENEFFSSPIPFLSYKVEF